MANPYKKAEEKKRVPPVGQHREEEPVIESPVDPVPEQSTNPLADMIEKKTVGKACGFYLSADSIKKLDKAAKQLKCSKSKALDLLIQKYL
jgi:hypothetical protein